MPQQTSFAKNFNRRGDKRWNDAPNTKKGRVRRPSNEMQIDHAIAHDLITRGAFLAAPEVMERLKL